MNTPAALPLQEPDGAKFSVDVTSDGEVVVGALVAELPGTSFEDRVGGGSVASLAVDLSGTAIGTSREAFSPVVGGVLDATMAMTSSMYQSPGGDRDGATVAIYPVPAA